MEKNVLFLVVVLILCVNFLFAQNNGCTESDCHKGLVSLKVVHDPVIEDCSTCHLESKKDHPKEGSKEFVLIEEVPEIY